MTASQLGVQQLVVAIKFSHNRLQLIDLQQMGDHVNAQHSEHS